MIDFWFFDRIKDDSDPEMTIGEMKKLHAVLHEHLFQCYGLNFDSLALTNISLPVLSAASNGNVSGGGTTFL